MNIPLSTLSLSLPASSQPRSLYPQRPWEVGKMWSFGIVILIVAVLWTFLLFAAKTSFSGVKKVCIVWVNERESGLSKYLRHHSPKSSGTLADTIMPEKWLFSVWVNVLLGSAVIFFTWIHFGTLLRLLCSWVCVCASRKKARSTSAANTTSIT